MPDTYQMTTAIPLPDGGIAEVGHQDGDVVILLHGTSRLALGAGQRNEFIKGFCRAEWAAEAWAAERVEVSDG
jgi:hypothetical protein